MKTSLRWIPAWLALSSFTLGGCSAGMAPATAPALGWSGGFQADAASYPRLAGAGSANTANGETAVSVSLTGAPAAALLPWHVHQGRCGSGGPIVGPAAAYPLLRTGTDGRATASVAIPEELLADAEYYVDVHAGPAELGTIVACGQLAPSRG